MEIGGFSFIFNTTIGVCIRTLNLAELKELKALDHRG